MTKEVRTLTLDNTLDDALAFFKKHRVHHAPVVSPEHDHEVTGIVSDRDALRYRPHLLGKAAAGEAEQKALNVSLSQVMTRNPVHVAPDTRPHEALSLMLNHHIDCLLVYSDPQELQGIVTARDFINVLLLYRRVCTGPATPERLRIVDLDLDGGVPLDKIFSRGAQTVRDVMSKEVVRVTAEDTLQTATELMASNEIRHLPVVDEKEKPIGMVSDREILSWLPVPEGETKEAASDAEFRARLFATKDPQALRHEKVSTVMRRDPCTITSGSFLVDAMTALHSQTIGGMAVVDPDDRCLVGMLTTTDVLRVFRVVLQLGTVR